MAGRADLREAQAQHLAKIAWAFARLRCRDAQLMDAIAAASVARIGDFTCQNLSLTAWSLATLTMAHRPLLDAIAGAAVPSVPQFRPQELANISWAFAKLKVAHGPLMAAVAAAALPRLGECKPQELANLAWAFATCACRDVANMAWSFSPGGVGDGHLMPAIAAAALRKMGDFNAQDLANTAWAFATLRLRDRPLLEASAARSVAQMAQFSPPELASLAWSYAVLKFPHEPLFDAMSAAARARLARGKVFDQHSLASIAWSCATLDFKDVHLMDALASASVSTVASAKPQDLANTAWAMASLELRDAQFFDAIASESLATLRGFKAGEIEMVVWSLAKMGGSAAWRVGRAAERMERLGSLAFGALWSESTLTGDIHSEVGLLRCDAVDKLGLGTAAGSAAAFTAAHRLAACGQVATAVEVLEEAPLLPVANCALAACGWPMATSPPSAVETRRMAEMSKAEVLLPFVFENAEQGDAAAVCQAYEDCSEQHFKPARLWFKIAGGEKAGVLLQALRGAPSCGSVLEIGTYLGYSAIRMASAQPNRRIVTLEVDPGAAMAARCLTAYAGVGHNVDIWTGHSKDLLSRLPGQYPPGLQFAAVFMDQCGSRFWEDLRHIIALDLLLPGAIVAADNVLKPGAPLFLWQAQYSGLFKSHIVSVPEFGMTGVEDWIAVLEYTPHEGKTLADVPEAPEEIMDLEWEAQRVREAAEGGPGSVDFRDWAAFSEWMKGRLAKFGIRAEGSAEAPEEGRLPED